MAFTEELDQWAGRINPSASEMVQRNLAVQSDLRQELADLRLKRRQLIETLRRNVKSVKTSVRKHEEIRHASERSFGHVLNVDDNVTQCYVIERILSNAGFTVGLAHNATDALEMAAANMRDILTRDCPTSVNLFCLLRNQNKAIKNVEYSLWSFCPQGLHGIYRCCAAGRNKTGNQCNDAEQNGNDNECQPIRSPHAIEHST
jgi:hypothetical protein